MFTDTPRSELVPVALGDEPADLVITGGHHVNVNAGEIAREDIAIAGGRIAVVGDVEYTIGDDTEVIEVDGSFVVPGLIEGHLHSYHSYINGTEFARLLLQHGTTACADGFYGQAIVAGQRGAEFCKEELQATPVKLIFLVPALAHQQMTTVGIPRTPSGLTLEEMVEMLAWDDCYGLEEPTYEPIVDGDEDYLELFQQTVEKDKVVTGHAALPSDRELTAYIASGASTDHEPTTMEGADQRARQGMAVLSRHGTGLPNLIETVRAVTERDIDPRNFGASGDVRLPGDLLNRGCIDANVRAAVEHGVDPITAIQMATINTAEALRVDQELGSIAPGKVADLVVVDSLAGFDVQRVIADGDVVVEGGELTATIEAPDYPDWIRDTIDLAGPVSPNEFVIEAEGDSATVRTISIPEGAALQTVKGEATLPIEDGDIKPEVANDIAKVAMLDRLEASGRTGIGFVEGFGLGAGALGFSYNAVRENVVVLGTNNADMSTTVNRIAELNGGVVATRDGEVRAEVPLPLFGLQSDQPASVAIEQFDDMDEAIRDHLECDRANPLFGLEFLLCPYPETPGIRISDYGLFDVGNREQLDLLL